ncbi:MAG: enoyl-CoA hydratase/isomerase family protein [Spirochaetes bacterium]|nr:MAG: enoyl-CoA hydratase/isomerase family protein [Spirochaetota bacterium]
MSPVEIRRDGKIAILTMDRPDRHNAFNEDMWMSLGKATDDLLAAMPRAIVITGAGARAFCAGFDVNPDNPQVAALVGAVQKHDPKPVEGLIRLIRTTVDRFTGLPVPVIAAVNGMAYGGGAELASRCDMRVADPAAVFCFSEVRLGLIPDWGGGVALARLIGTGRAADMILSARKVDAAEAHAMGLADRVSAPGKCLDEACALAHEIARNGPASVRAALAVIRASRELPMGKALDFESEQAIALIAGGECIHGITALLSKKEPEFPDVE